jgi:hypothetical protein
MQRTRVKATASLQTFRQRGQAQLAAVRAGEAKVKYLNKSFSVPGADIYMTDGWWNLEPAQISKGQWIKVGEGRERYVPEGMPLPREVDNA